MDNINKKYHTVQDFQTLKLMVEHIKQSDVIAVDTETTSLNVRKGKIIGFSISAKEGEGFYLPNLVWNSSTQQLDQQYIEGNSIYDVSIKLLKMMHGKKLVCHNSSFDLRYIKNFYGVDLLQDLWVDTALLVHTVQEEGAGMGVFGLKQLAISVQQEIGLEVEKAANQEQIELKQSINKNGGSTSKINFEIFKADLDILSKYASADTDLTLRLCNYFLSKLKKEKLEDFFFKEEVMPIYKEVTIPMEEYGVDLDMELINQTYNDIVKDIEKNKKVVMDSLLKLPEVKKWIVDTATKQHPPKNKGMWAQNLVQRFSLTLPKSEKTGKYSLTAKNISKLEDSPAKQFLQTGDSTLLEEIEIARISTNIWKERNDGDYLNVQSKKHLGEIVFDYMGIEPLTTTKKGAPRFDMSMVEHLAKTYTWANNLKIYNKLIKIKTTYLERFINNNEQGRYYPYFKQHGTVSGRYGSDLQQLPKPKEEEEDSAIIVKYTNLVRAFFIAGKHRKFIDADYTSLEPHCFASVTGDEALCNIFNNEHDFYSTVAIKTEKLDQDKQTYPNGVSADSKSKVFLKKIDPVKRQTAKSYSLGVAYGMSPYALGKTLDIPTKDAEKLVDGYLNGFPKLKKWREDSRSFVKKHGYITNYVGRVRHLPTVKKIYDKFGDNILDWRFRKNLQQRYNENEVNKVYLEYRNGLNGVLNYQLQSLAASVVNRAALAINRKAKQLEYDAVVVAQIHDQLVINIREDQAEEFAPIVQSIMENNLKLPGVTLKAPPEIADNLRDGH